MGLAFKNITRDSTSIWRATKIFIALASTFLIVCHSSAHATDQISKEFQVKSAFLLNFARYIKWPNHKFTLPDSKIEICILDFNPFGEHLNKYMEHKIEGRGIKISYFIEATELAGCHIVYTTIVRTNRLYALEQQAINQNFLLVTEIDNTGMINFLINDGKIRFKINQLKAQHAGLNISSQLLKVGIISDQEGHL